MPGPSFDVARAPEGTPASGLREPAEWPPELMSERLVLGPREPNMPSPLTEAAARLRTLAHLIALRRRLRRSRRREPASPPEREPR